MNQNIDPNTISNQTGVTVVDAATVSASVNPNAVPITETSNEDSKKPSPFNNIRQYLIGLIIGLLIMLIVMFYLFASGKLFFSDTILEKSEQEIIELEKKYEKSNKFVPLKIDKCLNNTVDDSNYYVINNYNNSLDISIIDNDIVINLTRDQFNSLSPDLSDNNNEFKITNIDYNISEIYVGYLGESIQELYIFVIDNNGSIYYSNLYNGIHGIKSHEFNNLELVKDVKDITKMFNAKVYKDDNYTYTMLGVLKDGSYYDMGLIIK